MISLSGTGSRPARRLAGVAAAVTLAAAGLVGATSCSTQSCDAAPAAPRTGGQGGGSGIVLAKGFTSHGSSTHNYSRSHEGETGGYHDYGDDEGSSNSGNRYRGGYHDYDNDGYDDDDYDDDDYDCSDDSPSPSPSDSYYYYDGDCTYSWCPTDTPSADDPYSTD